MDLNTIHTVLRPRMREALPEPAWGDAFLAGGTWLFSEPQRDLARLIDLQAMRWPAIVQTADTLSIAATCTLAALDAYAADARWPAAALMRRCCRSLWGSFKIWNAATVGGNLCLGLPAAPMAALAVALQGSCLLWSADGAERAVPAIDFVTGARRTCLEAGEMLRAIELPFAMLASRFAFRQTSLTVEGRSAALLIGRRDRHGFALTVTASTPRPLELAFATMPDEAGLLHAVDAAGGLAGWYDDVHGAPDWRRHMSLRLAAEIRTELA